MNELHNQAMLVIYQYVNSINKLSFDKDRSSLLSAAITNYLSGKEIQEIQLSEFDEEEITRKAVELIKGNHHLQELSVQSIRVLLAIHHGVGREVRVHEILEQFGNSFPNSPTPESFKSLIIEKENRLLGAKSESNENTSNNILTIKEVLFSWNGRLGRRRYLPFFIILFIPSQVFNLMGWVLPAFKIEIVMAEFLEVVLSIVFILFIYMKLSIDVKRLHDMGRKATEIVAPLLCFWVSGYIFFESSNFSNGTEKLVQLIALLSIIIFAVYLLIIQIKLLFFKGEAGVNKYGRPIKPIDSGSGATNTSTVKEKASKVFESIGTSSTNPEILIQDSKTKYKEVREAVEKEKQPINKGRRIGEGIAWYFNIFVKLVIHGIKIILGIILGIFHSLKNK